MPRNPTSTQTTSSGAAAARTARSRAARVTASKHSKAAAAEAATIMVRETPREEIMEETIASLTGTPVAEDPIETISKIAYGYWEKRAGGEGNALSDWVRAEEEYRRNLASA